MEEGGRLGRKEGKGRKKGKRQRNMAKKIGKKSSFEINAFIALRLTYLQSGQKRVKSTQGVANL